MLPLGHELWREANVVLAVERGCSHHSSNGAPTQSSRSSASIAIPKRQSDSRHLRHRSSGMRPACYARWLGRLPARPGLHGVGKWKSVKPECAGACPSLRRKSLLMRSRRASGGRHSVDEVTQIGFAAGSCSRLLAAHVSLAGLARQPGLGVGNRARRPTQPGLMRQRPLFRGTAVFFHLQ